MVLAGLQVPRHHHHLHRTELDSLSTSVLPNETIISPTGGFNASNTTFSIAARADGSVTSQSQGFWVDATIGTAIREQNITGRQMYDYNNTTIKTTST
ncbi:MAG: hypothetical protein M1827_005740 [Pycnora praestabilis]|nr:MAG: hypothetical protein M1827_005740 [Pycnora praestabilis]